MEAESTYSTQILVSGTIHQYMGLELIAEELPLRLVQGVCKMRLGASDYTKMEEIHADIHVINS